MNNKYRRIKTICLSTALSSLLLISGCVKPVNTETVSWVLITKEDSKESIIHKASLVAPDARQLAWQKKEFLAFIHFGSDRRTSPETFNPEEFNADQWVEVCKNTGMKMMILTTKHHNGFCLWPSKYTDYSVKSSPWKDGKGDMVKEVAEACQRAGLEFGVYLSPWDIHEPSYGTEGYDEYFKNQLSELLTNYGPISEVWFDGFYGGPKGEKHDYKWKEYYTLIRKLQPEAVIAINGPDVRWVGNEDGYARESEWSVLPVASSSGNLTGENIGYSTEDIYPFSYNWRDKDIGSKNKLLNMEPPYYLVWYPAETDVSFRPSWGFRPDEHPRPIETLLDIYYSSIARNSVLLLNFTPDHRGLIPDEDVQQAKDFRKILDTTFKEDLLLNSRVKISESRKGYRGKAVVDGNMESFWTTPEGVNSAFLEFDLGGEKKFNRFLLQEFIKLGQRVESFSLEAWDGNKWNEFANGTTIGYKRILRFDDVTTEKIRLNIKESRACPILNNCGLFYQPPVEEILNRK